MWFFLVWALMQPAAATGDCDGVRSWPDAYALCRAHNEEPDRCRTLQDDTLRGQCLALGHGSTTPCGALEGDDERMCRLFATRRASSCSSVGGSVEEVSWCRAILDGVRSLCSRAGDRTVLCRRVVDTMEDEVELLAGGPMDVDTDPRFETDVNLETDAPLGSDLRVGSDLVLDTDTDTFVDSDTDSQWSAMDVDATEDGGLGDPTPVSTYVRPTRVPLGTPYDELRNMLKASARNHRSHNGKSSGTFVEGSSRLDPVVSFLRVHPKMDLTDLGALEVLLEGLSEEAVTKYSLPVRRLHQRIDEARGELTGNDGSDENRAAVRGRLATRPTGPLSAYEQEAIATYKKPEGFASLNRGLREGGPLSDEDREQALYMVDGLRKLPVHAGASFRGADRLIGGLTEATIGEVYTEAGFLSASRVPAGAFSGSMRIRIVGHGSIFDAGGVFDRLDPNAASVDHFEDEVIGLPGIRLRYQGLVDGWHRYEEVR